ncbi:DUF4175 family protein [Fulvivirga lutea]|uniref:Tryptophan-rich sensory protein n=1 Tax=Fulvivirga lutea TaxID=2810512 RepID=A0A974ZZT0_9BACT|nr:DUF4175 family protein [Fulvivirga lutea]QSE96624.1 hypothetical protein JR347_13600 [Fulvivirga lutea]
MKSGIDILNKVTLKWRLVYIANAFLLAIGLTLLISFVIELKSLGWLALIFILSLALFILVYRPWKINAKRSSRWLDLSFGLAQNSSFLLVSEVADSSLIAQVQRKRISEILLANEDKIGWPASLKNGFIGLALFVISGLLLSLIDINSPSEINEREKGIEFISTDSVITDQALSIINQEVRINYPKYTKLATTTSENFSVTALEGSYITWTVTFSEKPKSLILEMNNGKQLPFKAEGGSYKLTSQLIASGFYKLIYTDINQKQYETELYQLIATPDKEPEVSIEGIDRFTVLEIDEPWKVQFTSKMSDDYGLDSTAIVATVSKGSGEAVKFREERMAFDKSLKVGGKRQSLSKSIDIAKLDMTPGDELYFYVEVFDYKRPKPNRNRTETYFVSIRDTTKIEFSLEGALGVDLMPEYFRSQRQIIIDTEKLVKQRGKIPKNDFNFTSNELGFDQKSLRLKYGQFMGEEFESGMTESESESAEADHDHDEEDPLAEYSHAHDSDNEHNLVPESEKKEDPLDEFKHDHEDPEEATLFTSSIKGKLRAAMNEMWDAELYLRLYQPEKSLPYQYKALELIKEIKNHARIYVHRIGFDPPPIKEDKRLSGDVKEVQTGTSTIESVTEKSYPAIEKAIFYIDELIKKELKAYESDIFKNAGNELAAIAIDQPGKHFMTLQLLQKLNLKQVDETILFSTLRKVQSELSKALPSEDELSPQNHSSEDRLTRAYLNQLTNSMNK